MKNFKVMLNGIPTLISNAPWEFEESKKKLDPNKEVFIGISWNKYVTDAAEGYLEKGMTTVPLVAYMLSDKTTYRKVKEHFDYANDAD